MLLLKTRASCTFHSGIPGSPKLTSSVLFYRKSISSSSMTFRVFSLSKQTGCFHQTSCGWCCMPSNEHIQKWEHSDQREPNLDPARLWDGERWWCCAQSHHPVSSYEACEQLNPSDLFLRICSQIKSAPPPTPLWTWVINFFHLNATFHLPLLNFILLV